MLQIAHSRAHVTHICTRQTDGRADTDRLAGSVSALPVHRLADGQARTQRASERPGSAQRVVGAELRGGRCAHGRRAAAQRVRRPAISLSTGTARLRVSDGLSVKSIKVSFMSSRTQESLCIMYMTVLYTCIVRVAAAVRKDCCTSHRRWRKGGHRRPFLDHSPDRRTSSTSIVLVSLSKSHGKCPPMALVTWQWGCLAWRGAGNAAGRNADEGLCTRYLAEMQGR